MHRVARRLFTPCSAASLVLFVTVCAFWLRSYGNFDTVAWYANEWRGTAVSVQARGVAVDSGGLMVFTMDRGANFGDDPKSLARFRASSPPFRGLSHLRLEPCGYPYMDPEYAGQRGLGFGHFSGARNPPIVSAADRDRYVIFPFWLPAALAAVLPAAWCRERIVRNHREQHGLCPACGYDLRATPGRCPESV